MRINETTVLVGQSAILVPYRKEHVEKYHRWMKDPEIREQTASEPLSIDEEYEMQRSWHLDEDKLTFIVLSRDGAEEVSDVQKLISSSVMAGDVNLFISERHDDDHEEGDDAESSSTVMLDAELEVMIAEPSCRRRGLAKEALAMLMHYASTEQAIPDSLRSRYLPLTSDAFVAKVGIENGPSIALFQRLGFHEVLRSEIWKEAELRPRSEAAVQITKPMLILQWPMP